MDQAVRDYIDGIAPEHRPMFDRVHSLVLGTAPGATVRISYGIPTYELGGRRLYVGAWKHGLSIYGWGPGGDGGFLDRHPELLAAKGTIRLRPADAATVTDDDLRALVRAALAVT